MLFLGKARVAWVYCIWQLFSDAFEIPSCQNTNAGTRNFLGRGSACRLWVSKLPRKKEICAVTGRATGKEWARMASPCCCLMPDLGQVSPCSKCQVHWQSTRPAEFQTGMNCSCLQSWLSQEYWPIKSHVVSSVLWLLALHQGKEGLICGSGSSFGGGIWECEHSGRLWHRHLQKCKSVAGDRCSSLLLCDRWPPSLLVTTLWGSLSF